MEEVNQKKMENLNAIKSFLEKDMKIKEEMTKIAPSELDDADEEARIEYTDRLRKKLDDIEIEFLLGIKKLNFGQEVENAISNYFENAKKKIEIGKYENGIGIKIYSELFSNMRESFIENVKNECVGYTLKEPKDLAKLIEKSTTINELLHAIHSYVVNNETILQSMPKINEKQNTIEEDIILYGEPNEIATDIFENFPLELDCGGVDIISLKDKVLMMIRDIGHALTMDIDTKNENDIAVKYFIPKLCNQKMIEALPGVNKSSITKSGATGIFISSKDTISKDLYDFIERVPTDEDIEFYYAEIKNKQKDEEKINLNKTKEENQIFKIEDAKEIAIQPGKNGRKLSKIEQIKNKIIAAIKNLKEKVNGIGR